MLKGDELAVVDVLLVAEIAWCALVMRGKGVLTTLLYAGGILTSGYVAAHLSGWLANRFVPPVSPAFLWLQNHIAEDSQSVSALSPFLPPVATSGGFQNSQWIALHLVKTFFFLAITTAVFVLFVVMDTLSEALWDRPQSSGQRSSIVSTSLSVACGVYAAGLTVILLANLSWIENFSGIAPQLTHSLATHSVGRAWLALQGWILP